MSERTFKYWLKCDNPITWVCDDKILHHLYRTYSFWGPETCMKSYAYLSLTTLAFLHSDLRRSPCPTHLPTNRRAVAMATQSRARGSGTPAPSCLPASSPAFGTRHTATGRRSATTVPLLTRKVGQLPPPCQRPEAARVNPPPSPETLVSQKGALRT